LKVGQKLALNALYSSGMNNYNSFKKDKNELFKIYKMVVSLLTKESSVVKLFVIKVGKR
jgi:hypothetical protein